MDFRVLVDKFCWLHYLRDTVLWNEQILPLVSIRHKFIHIYIVFQKTSSAISWLSDKFLQARETEKLLCFCTCERNKEKNIQNIYTQRRIEEAFAQMFYSIKVQESNPFNPQHQCTDQKQISLYSNLHKTLGGLNGLMFFYIWF